MIARALEVIPGASRWCVEFGAWDGILHSNTRLLLKDPAWSGVLIEADPDRFLELQRTYQKHPRVTCLNKLVDFTGPNTLDRVLRQTPIPHEFDVLSIDIDGNDYHVWQSLRDYRPKLVVIEYNPTVPNSIAFVQQADFYVSQGSSLLALTRLGKSKGYELVAASDVNAFFVERELFPLFAIDDNSLDAVHTDQQYITHVFQLFDGTLAWSGCDHMLWFDVKLDPERLQMIPKTLRFSPTRRRPLSRTVLRGLYLRWLRLRYGRPTSGSSPPKRPSSPD